jgi:1-acyl-sn-glycerol-3-phosphate acyltransferase
MPRYDPAVNPDRLAATARTGMPGVPVPWVVFALRRFVRPLVRVYFRATLEGVERLPRGVPFLLVANHGGAVALAEILSFAALMADDVDEERPLAGFAHPFGFHIWPISACVRAIGAVPSTYAAAASTLARGVPLLVFPGGDHEAARPVWYGNTVDFGGRVGFLRIARDAGVPVVPMGIRGAHYTAPVLLCSRTILPRGLLLMRLLGLKRYPLTVLGLAGVLAIATLPPWAPAWKVLAAWLWLGATVLPFLPWVPWKVRMRIGTPIAAPDLFDGTGSDEDLRAALVRVQGAVGELVGR